MLVRFVGDIHGRFNGYLKLVEGSEFSIQVGDFGIGFETLKNPIPDLDGEHYFIRGNHDNPAKCRMQPNFLEDGPDSQDIMFFLGGAYSVDNSLRTEGVDWWADEELTVVELNKVLDAYELRKPSIVVTHDCPTVTMPFPLYKNPSRTSQALDAMYEIHPPKLWVFGHHHRNIDVVVDGTRFVCVDKMSYKDINIGEYL